MQIAEPKINTKHGCFTILDYTKTPRGYSCLCKCDCGKELKLSYYKLSHGERKSCGCIWDLTGRCFGRLVVLGKVDGRRYSDYLWQCECECGNLVEVPTRLLKQRKTTSCGCYKKEIDTFKIVKKGSDNPAWKGGITPLKAQLRQIPLYKQWVLEVFQRDTFKCLLCKKKGGKLEAHHKKHFSHILEEYNITSLNEAMSCNALWDIDNGITLCKKCHKQVHNKNFKFVWKPWGVEHWLALNEHYCYKRIYINAGHRTSLQYHERKKETNYIIEGLAEVWLEDDDGKIVKTIMKANDYFNVDPPRQHRVVALTDLILQEVSTPEVQDVIRVQDDAGRPDGWIKEEENQ